MNLKKKFSLNVGKLPLGGLKIFKLTQTTSSKRHLLESDLEEPFASTTERLCDGYHLDFCQSVDGARTDLPVLPLRDSAREGWSGGWDGGRKVWCLLLRGHRIQRA